MPDAMTHPTPQQLADFGLGKLPERAAAVIAAHLESCSVCRLAVARVSADSFLGKVRDAGKESSSFPPSLANPSQAPKNASKATPPLVACPGLPPELANHPKYHILRELGRGGMGVVYQARHKEMQRQVVIKVISRALLDRPDTLERFHREIRAAAQLSHPNIVTAYDAEQVGESHMLVMEFVPGLSLAEVVQKKGLPPVANVCHYMRQAAMGLQHAHERKLVHRDIKPQNLMLSLKNQIKILDFGLAKVYREEDNGTWLTSNNAYMGTPDFCAPEQARNARTADIRADLYSLGCTLYYLLSGRPPFREDTVVNTILAHLQKQPQPLPELRPDLPVELWQVVARLLAKEPDQRYQKPIEVAQALTPFVKSGAKSDAKGGSAHRQDAESPIKGTVLAADTGEIKNILREVPGKVPPKKAPAKEAEASPFADLVDSNALPKNAEGASEAKKRTPVGWSRYWPVLAGAGLFLLVLLGMWAGGMFKVKSPDETKAISEKKPVDPSGPISNSIGMKFVLVKPGTFRMGSPENEAERYGDEEQHTVQITRPFYVGVNEVTQQQYERVTGKNPSWFCSTGGGKDKVQNVDTRQFPVENVLWLDTDEFCRLLSEMPEEKGNGRKYRLPTEAEWEYCCRGGHFFKSPSPIFHFGNSLTSTQANFDGNWPFPKGVAPKGPHLERAREVGFYPPNSLGLYDLHGNVCEWCADWYDATYYKDSPPQDPRGPERGHYHVSRGGSWDNTGSLCRTAYRHPQDDRSRCVGFRVVFTVGARP